MLPDRSFLIGQKLVENAKIEKFKCDIFGDFQTLYAGKKNVLVLKIFFFQDTKASQRICLFVFQNPFTFFAVEVGESRTVSSLKYLNFYKSRFFTVWGEVW